MAPFEHEHPQFPPQDNPEKDQDEALRIQQLEAERRRKLLKAGLKPTLDWGPNSRRDDRMGGQPSL